MRFLSRFIAVSLLLCGPASFAQSPYAQWSRGPSTNADYFPIGVWVQNPKNAERYKAAGINLYVALSGRPSAERFDLL
jgi:hypothetical protein